MKNLFCLFFIFWSSLTFSSDHSDVSFKDILQNFTEQSRNQKKSFDNDLSKLCNSVDNFISSMFYGISYGISYGMRAESFICFAFLFACTYEMYKQR
jgi:hypothetical protein